MKKIDAFTLTELIVVMIVSTIVVSMAFMALSMVKRQVGSIQNRFQKKEELVRFEKIIHKDFNNYGIGNLKGNNNVQFKNALDSVMYQIKDTYVLRNKDTFAIAIHNSAFLLDGKKVNSGFIDAFRFEAQHVNNRSSFVYAEKDAAFYVND
ncbi:PulJ/GspJ family protein [Tenacibaculum agarivorans]|uniref:PulJ/GspJ family protein n=1 Tax=Tenacibaculum agarivorans TaxID=1908389 RepID=UPI00094BA7E5|nr:prepilin-type N-terminal cleavage/methylation domain-containing protein [Tenacibaculum agarivorans]